MHISGTPSTPCYSITTAESLCTYPAWRAKRKSHIEVRPRELNQGRGTIQRMDQPSTLFDQSYPIGRTESANNDYLFKVQITTFAEHGKIQLTPKITNHLFKCYLNCMCKSNPVFLIHHWSVTFLLASYVQ